MQALSPLQRCKPWIEAALARNGGECDFGDVEAGVASGKMQLWPAEKGCLVTELVEFPQKKLISVFLGGGDLEQLADMHKDVIAWAKTQGCSGARIIGRRGWVRAFEKYGWTEKATVLAKEL